MSPNTTLSPGFLGRQPEKDTDMPRSASSLLRSGAISTKAYNATLAKTRAQKSKMAEFNDRQKDEGDKENDGAVRIDHINNKQFQRMKAGGGADGVPSKGGRSLGNEAPKPGQIDQASMQKKKFPHGGHFVGKGNKSGPAGHIGVKGGVVQSGPYMGGGKRNAQ
jgi:hypothetical protein